MQRLDTHQDDEIDLKELFLTLWRGKIAIFFMCGLALLVAVKYLHGVERTYLIKAIYKSVSQDVQRPNLGGFGGLASLAGVAMPSSSDSDFIALQALLTSEEISDVLMNDKDLIRFLFGSEWDDERQIFAQPIRRRLSDLNGFLRKVLTGHARSEYIPPNSQRLSVKLKKLATISVDKTTGYLIISSETAHTQRGIYIIQKIVSIADDLLKKRYVTNAEATLAFYQEKIASARSREQREALAKLMVQEDQKLMLAARGKDFVVEPIMRPTTTLDPTYPKTKLVLALSILLGGFVGSAAVLIQASLTPREEKSNA